MPSCSATTSSLIDCDSRSLRNSLPSRRRRTVGPTGIATPRPEAILTVLRSETYLVAFCCARLLTIPDTQCEDMRFHLCNLRHALARRASSPHHGQQWTIRRAARGRCHFPATRYPGCPKLAGGSGQGWHPPLLPLPAVSGKAAIPELGFSAG